MGTTQSKSKSKQSTSKSKSKQSTSKSKQSTSKSKSKTTVIHTDASDNLCYGILDASTSQQHVNDVYDGVYDDYNADETHTTRGSGADAGYAEVHSDRVQYSPSPYYLFAGVKPLATTHATSIVDSKDTSALTHQQTEYANTASSNTNSQQQEARRSMSITQNGDSYLSSQQHTNASSNLSLLSYTSQLQHIPLGQTAHLINTQGKVTHMATLF